MEVKRDGQSWRDRAIDWKTLKEIISNWLGLEEKSDRLLALSGYMLVMLDAN